MWLLCAAVVLAVLKVLAHLEISDVGGVSAMSWWWVLGGFALTAAWFAYADHSGLTQRKVTQRIEKRKQDRIQKQREMLGTRRKR